MNTFFKLFTLGLLLVAVPVVARNHDDRKYNNDCCFGNIYNGLLSFDNATYPFTFQIRQDGTVEIIAGDFVFIGTSKCKGNQCFTFCATNNNGDAGDADVSFEVYAGTVSFSDCCAASITNFTVNYYSDPGLTKNIGTFAGTVTNLTLQNCN